VESVDYCLILASAHAPQWSADESTEASPDEEPLFRKSSYSTWNIFFIYAFPVVFYVVVLSTFPLNTRMSSLAPIETKSKRTAPFNTESVEAAAPKIPLQANGRVQNYDANLAPQAARRAGFSGLASIKGKSIK
jgi:hypothetical protein